MFKLFQTAQYEIPYLCFLRECFLTDPCRMEKSQKTQDKYTKLIWLTAEVLLVKLNISFFT